MRTPVEVVAWSDPYAATWNESTIGLGNLGLIGTGRGGGGTGSGYGIGSGGRPSGTTTGLRGEWRDRGDLAKADPATAHQTVLVPTTPAPSMDFKRAAKSSMGYASRGTTRSKSHAMRPKRRT